MTFPDLGNALFELFGGILIWLNVYKLHKDKEIKGISWIPICFWMLWGFWNLYFYPAVGAWLSFVGGIMIVVANTVWLIQMVYYARKERYGVSPLADMRKWLQLQEDIDKTRRR